MLDSTQATWQRQYIKVAVNYLSRHVFVTGEDIRLECEKRGIGQPHHPNVWGVMFHSLSRKGRAWIKPTDEWIKASDPQSHARNIRFWRSTIYRGVDSPRVEVIEYQA